MNLSAQPVLQLNASFEPVSIISAKRAIKLLCKSAAEAVVEHDRELYPGFRLPSVIRLVRYRHIPNRTQLLNRKNIYSRDRYTCQYCRKVLPPAELTLDHVMPQSRGGRDTWENLVTCCRQDNRRKADRTPEEAGMVLLHRPRPVTVHTARHLLRNLGEPQTTWRQYLYFENLTPQVSE